MTDAAVQNGFTSRFHWSGYLLGLALGGFFDGILLHQILQWHHLLSGLDGDLRFQVLADGIFHALMYVVAVAGGWLLWRARHEFSANGADRILLANVLIGFGIWHALDAVLSHWILGIHRIRQDAANPLVWDIIWLVLFGVIPLVVGIYTRRNTGSGRAMRGNVAAILLVGLVSGSGAVAALPPSDVSQTIVYFRPGTTAKQVFAAAAAVDARVIWSDRSGELWAFDIPDPSRTSSLYRHGALLVGGSRFAIGCIS
jgi:uncharacterized membrane protein